MKSFEGRASIVAALPAALPLGALASTTLSAQDSTFVIKATQAGIAEVQFAALALRKSQNAAV